MANGTTGGKDELARTLRDLREAAGLSTRTAGGRAGWSQAKVSRLETGRNLPSPTDVGRLADVYEVSPAVRRRLVRLATDVQSWSRRVVLNRGGNEFQAVLNDIEESSELVRTYSPAIVPGLLQTPEYARAIFTSFGATSRTPEQVDKAVTTRIERQARIGTSGRRFVLITTEGALGWQARSPAVMVEQLEHIAKLDRPGLEVGIIPWGAAATVFPLHTWDMYDNRAVSFGTVASTALLTAPQDVDAYAGIFGQLRAMAEFGDGADAVLARAIARYRAM